MGNHSQPTPLAGLKGLMVKEEPLFEDLNELLFLDDLAHLPPDELCLMEKELKAQNLRLDFVKREGDLLVEGLQGEFDDLSVLVDGGEDDLVFGVDDQREKGEILQAALDMHLEQALVHFQLADINHCLEPLTFAQLDLLNR